MAIKLLEPLLIALCLISSLNASPSKNPFYVIANMANSEEALDFAVRSGANAVTLDLSFTSDGNPDRFESPSKCDCLCRPNVDMCKHGLHSSCSGPTASSEAAKQLNRIAEKPEIALVIIHAKVHAVKPRGLKHRGDSVITLVDRNLFGHGYEGNLVIASGKIETYDFIEFASDSANRSKNANRYFFTFQNEGDNYRDVESLLTQLTARRVFGTGISACLPGTYYNAIEKAVAGKEKGEIGFLYVWTLDQESSMKEYINRGVEGIITNEPSLLRSVVDNMKLKIATTNDHIKVCTKKVERLDQNCNCNYHLGGCTISSPAPPNHACKCYKKFLTACGGEVVSCSRTNDTKCKSPDESEEACQLGGGNCGGY